MASAQRVKITGIEAARGIAALLVASVHSSDHLTAAYGPFFLGRVFAFGHAGVDFFFVLSGFIILWVHADDIDRPRRVWHYAKRRIARVAPLLWVVILFGLVLAQFRSVSDVAPVRILFNALLLPTVSDPFIGVAWTLQHEALFYALFATLILSRRLGLAVFAGWFALILAFAWGRVSTDSGLLFRLGAWFDLQFFLGMVAAWVLRRRRVPSPLLVLGLGVAAFLAAGVAEDMGLVPASSLALHLGYGVAAMVIVLGLVESERSGRLAVPRSLVRLGSASYSIYLTHIFTIGLLWQFLLKTSLASSLPPGVEILLMLVAAALVGLAVSLTIEQPGSRVMRALLDGKRPLAPAWLSGLRRGLPQAKGTASPGE